MEVIFIIFLSTWGYNSLGHPTRQHKVWKKILLQADPIEKLTACVLAANTKQTQLFNVSDQISHENNQNEMKLRNEFDYDYQDFPTQFC